MKVIYFDTETTGVIFGSDKIIELAMHVYEDGEKVFEFDELIKVDKRIPNKIIKLTGIDSKMISDEGVDCEVAARELKRQLKDKPLMIAHNTQFDLNFIYHFLLDYYEEEDVLKLLSECKWLDTLTILKDRKSYPHKLKDMVEYYSIDTDEFHRAGDDAGVLHECVLALRSERNDLKEYVNVFGYPPKYGVSGMEFDFITYKAQEYHNGLCNEEDILPYCEPLKRY